MAGTVTVNASAAESIETPYRSPTLSSFPSNASLEDFEKTSDNEDLRIISSPSRGANYKTRAAEAVALLRIYSTTGSGSSSSFHESRPFLAYDHKPVWFYGKHCWD